MSNNKIKIALIHILDRTIHEGVITLTGDYPNCGIIFTSSISRDLEVKGHDYYQCLLNLRIELEKQNYYILCQGARKDVSCWGTLRESSGGCLGEIIKPGIYSNSEGKVYIFDYAEPDLIVSVREQQEFEYFYHSSLEMGIKSTKVSLIYILDRTIHEGVITLTGDYPNCGIILTSSISKNLEVKGHDYYQSLLNLRIELEKQNYYILCQGARKDVSCGGMLRQSSDGCLAYIIRLGEYCHLDEDVEVFAYADRDLVVSIKEQEEFQKLHRNSLPEIVNYYGEFSESISERVRENIIDRLCSHSDWQFLQRKSLLSIFNVQEGDRLLFKFLNTPDRPHWNIEIEIYNDLINLILTLGNDTNRETFLVFLNEQLSLNRIVCKIRTM